MVNQPVYDNCAFVIMENYMDMIFWEESTPGGGTARLRPYSLYHQDKTTPLRALAVPTGWSTDARGFCELEHYNKTLIDLSFQRMTLLLQTKLAHVTTLYFSCDATDPTRIGTGIFAKSLHKDVINYISTNVMLLPVAVQGLQARVKEEDIRNEEYKMWIVAYGIDQRAIVRKHQKLAAGKRRAEVALARHQTLLKFV